MRLYAIEDGEEYRWIKSERDMGIDIFCLECRYDYIVCGYNMDNCPYRKISQREYFERSEKRGY